MPVDSGSPNGASMGSRAQGWGSGRGAGLAAECTDVTGRSCSVGTCQAGRWMGLNIKTPESLSCSFQLATGSSTKGQSVSLDHDEEETRAVGVLSRLVQEPAVSTHPPSISRLEPTKPGQECAEAASALTWTDVPSGGYA